MRFFRLLLCLVGIGVLAGCARTLHEEIRHDGRPQQIPTQRFFPRDDLGRAVNLHAPAQRVVCIGPGAVETIFALGTGKLLVGRDQFSDYPTSTKGIPVVGDYTGPFAEKVVAVRPDLVIVQGETYDKTRADNWQQKIGVPVAVLVPTSVSKVVEGIGKIGRWLECPAAAAKLARGFELELASKNVAGAPHAFFEVQRSPLWTAGKSTLIASVLSAAGIGNVAGSVSGYKQFSTEALLAKEPTLYIVAQNKPDPKRVLRELRQDDVLGKLQCVRKGNIIVLPADWLLRPGPRLQKGIAALQREARRLNSK
jgi:iron complex transport system substrate-binding protein